MLARVILVALCTNVFGYRILIYNPRFLHSHSNFVGNIADVIHDAGHEVDVLVPVMDPNVKSGVLKANIIEVEANEEAARELHDFTASDVDLFEISPDNPIGNFFLYRIMASIFTKQCRHTLQVPGLLEKLKQNNYDLFMAEPFDYCGIGISELLKKPTITVASSAIFDKVASRMGMPVAPSYNPAMSTASLDVHSIVSRARNLYRALLWEHTFVTYEFSERLFRELYGPSFPSHKIRLRSNDGKMWYSPETLANAAYHLVNNEPLIDFARPILKKVVDIAGIGAKPPQPLDEYWNKVLGLRKKNILLSFGSILKSNKINIDYRRSILETMSRFPDVTFIWKYEELDDDFAKNEVSAVKNVVLNTWTPQNDLLNDTRMTLFITHGGMGSTQETASRGVPGIFIPLFGDQPRNAGMMAHTGVGVVFSKYDIRYPDKFEAAIREVLENDRYTKNAKRIAKMIARRPFSPRELLLKHVEFAAEFGASENHKPLSLDLSFIEYHMLDVLFLLGLFALAASATLLLLLRSAYRTVFVKAEEKAKRA